MLGVADLDFESVITKRGQDCRVRIDAVQFDAQMRDATKKATAAAADFEQRAGRKASSSRTSRWR